MQKPRNTVKAKLNIGTFEPVDGQIDNSMLGMYICVTRLNVVRASKF